jgi:hypothetical protein
MLSSNDFVVNYVKKAICVETIYGIQVQETILNKDTNVFKETERPPNLDPFFMSFWPFSTSGPSHANESSVKLIVLIHHLIKLQEESVAACFPRES